MMQFRSLLLVCLYLVTGSQADFMLTSTPPKVEPGLTEDLTLDCSFLGQPQSSAFSTISRIRILKDTGVDNWNIMAEVREFESTAENVGLDPSANVTGYIGIPEDSYLRVRWTTVTASVFGRYRCDIIGFKPNSDVLIEKTPEYIIAEANATLQDVLDLFLKQKDEIDQLRLNQQAYCDAQVSASEAKMAQELAEFKANQSLEKQQLENKLMAELAGIKMDVQRLMDTGVLQYWPEGTYALLMPDSGCPNNVGAIWETGYRRFHTESTDRNYDQVSSPYLKNPVLERVDINNFVYQHFCVSSTRSPGADWPRGSYCINRQGGVCPSGFNSGFITWQDEVTDSAALVTGVLPDGQYEANQTSIYYCCRADAPANQPIYLPHARPFYLYRYNGTCQQVVGMSVLPGDMTFDTDSSNGDAYENSFHPDGQIDDVIIQLCYYQELP